MKKTLRYILSIVGLASVLIFCVSATAAITDTQSVLGHTYSEPLTMLLLGFGLMGFGTFLKSRFSR